MIDICKQIPCCSGFYIINKLDVSPIYADYYKSPFGQSNVEWFFKKIINPEFRMREFSKLGRKPKIPHKSDKSFSKAKICWLCDREFRNMNDKVKHFCKISDEYLGAAHKSCIDFVIKVNQHKFSPVFYHNFSSNFSMTITCFLMT